MFGRAFTEMFGVMLLSRWFWAFVAFGGVVLLVESLLENPVTLVALAGVVIVVVIAVALLNHHEAQILPINGQRVSVSKFQCSRCAVVGQLRVEKRTQQVPGGTVQWPFVVCRNCGHEEQVPGRVVG